MRHVLLIDPADQWSLVSHMYICTSVRPSRKQKQATTLHGPGGPLNSQDLLIHSANQQLRLIVIIIKNIIKTKQFSNGSNVHYWRDCGSGQVDH